MRTEAQNRWRRKQRREHPESRKEEKAEHARRHREHLREYNRKYQRNHRIKTRLVALSPTFKDYPAPNKRNYPNDGKCEICRGERWLLYHHWDDNDFSKGIWICQSCHIKVHQLIKRNRI